MDKWHKTTKAKEHYACLPKKWRKKSLSVGTGFFA